MNQKEYWKIVDYIYQLEIIDKNRAKYSEPESNFQGLVVNILNNSE